MALGSSSRYYRRTVARQDSAAWQTAVFGQTDHSDIAENQRTRTRSDLTDTQQVGLPQFETKVKVTIASQEMHTRTAQPRNVLRHTGPLPY